MKKLLFLLLGVLFFANYVFSQNLAVCGRNVDLTADVENCTDIAWYCDGATGTFSNANSLNTTFLFINYIEPNQVARLYYRAIVGESVVSDTVTVEFLQVPVVNAGPDLLICGLDFQLYATSSHVEGDNITGFWTCLGSGTATFSDVTDPHATCNYSQYGSVAFIWTDVNHPRVNTESDVECKDVDTVVVTFNEVPSGSIIMSIGDTVACGLTFESLRAETPEGGAFGYWYEEDPSTQFSMVDSPVTNVTVSSYGRHNFYWIEAYELGACESSSGPWTVNFVRQPMAEMSVPAGPYVANANVLFDNTTDYQDLGNVVCEWYFGDGASESNCSESVGHVYAEPNCYEPYLVVKSSIVPQCRDTARLENCLSVTSGIADFNVADIDISPNPATNFLNITSGEVISDIEIVNMMGQVVKRMEVNADNAVCDVNGLANGVYVVRIYNRSLNKTEGTDVVQMKFIKE